MQSDLRTAILILMVGLVALSILYNRGPDPKDIPRFMEFGKIIVIALFTTGLVNSRDRLRLLMWVIAISFAFYGFDKRRARRGGRRARGRTRALR